MSVYHATIEWDRQGGDADGADFLAGRYSRYHTLRFDGAVVPASAAAVNVPEPYAVADAVDPEEMFVASLSSCHMLWFLDFAKRAGLVVESYLDEAYGVLAKDYRGLMVMTEVVLRPKVTLADPNRTDELPNLHHQAHDACFIANSVTSEVRIEPA
jgi:organic hydroperoxide reductase OsmC/OhrA